MIFLKKNGDRLKRFLCLLVAAAMTLSLIPPPASAADDSIKLTSCDFTSISYHSEALGNASIHTIDVVYNNFPWPNTPPSTKIYSNKPHRQYWMLALYIQIPV